MGGQILTTTATTTTTTSTIATTVAHKICRPAMVGKSWGSKDLPTTHGRQLFWATRIADLLGSAILVGHKICRPPWVGPDHLHCSGTRFWQTDGAPYPWTIVDEVMAGMMKTIADDPIEAVRKEERRIDQRRQGLNTTLVASSAQELHAAARALAAIGVVCLAFGWPWTGWALLLAATVRVLERRDVAVTARTRGESLRLRGRAGPAERAIDARSAQASGSGFGFRISWIAATGARYLGTARSHLARCGALSATTAGGEHWRNATCAGGVLVVNVSRGIGHRTVRATSSAGATAHSNQHPLSHWRDGR